MLYLLFACLPSEKGLDPADAVEHSAAVDSDARPPEDTDLPPPPPPPDPPEVVCDGLDDDGDGAADDGWPDGDADGAADCVDTCFLRVPVAGPAPWGRCPDESWRPPADPWRVEVAWAWRGATLQPNHRDVAMTPLVGQLTDDNQDGRVDHADSPDVVFFAGLDYNDRYGTLVVLDGATGATHLELPDFIAGNHNEGALADVDRDGVPEILAVRSDAHLVALQADGRTVWETAGRVSWPLRIYVADVEGDGVVDIFANELRLDGGSGRVVARTAPPETGWPEPLAWDQDGDGFIEWWVGRELFSEQGDLRQRVPGPQLDFFQHLPFRATAPGQGPLMPAGSLGGPVDTVLFGQGQVAALALDGSVKWEREFAGGGPGPAAAADLDGDGAVEMVLPMGSALHALSSDGAALWTTPVDDLSSAAGVIAADLDGDGAFEVLFAGEARLRVLSGRDGRQLLAWSPHSSQTFQETPVVADLDGDGSPEILVASNTPHAPGDVAGVTALRHPERGWAPTSQGWNSPVFDGAVRDDLAVLVAPPTGLRSDGSFRAAPAWSASAGPHHAVSFLGACSDGAGWDVVVQVSNRGRSRAEAARLEVRVESGGATTVLHTSDIPSLDGGLALASLVVAVPADLSGEAVVVAEIVGGQHPCGDGAVATWRPTR